jgi:hypothetical protein
MFRGVSMPIAVFNFLDPEKTIETGEFYAESVDCSPASVSVAHSTNIDWASMTSALATKVKGRLAAKSQLAVSLLELHKTIQMVRNPFGLLKTDWRRLARNFSASSLSKRGINLWLEQRYGWRPLLNDFRNFAKSYGQVASHYRKTTPAEGVAEQFSEQRVALEDVPYTSLRGWSYGPNDDTAVNFMYSFGAQVFDIRPTTQKLTIAKIFAKRPAVIPITGALLRSIAQSFGVSSARDLLATIWEVVPYSFVVDWFINAKGMNALLDRDYLQSEPLLNCGTSLKTSYFFEGTAKLSCGNGATFITWRFPHTYLRSSTPGSIQVYNRSVGLPSIEAVLIQNGLTVLHAADLVALVAQRLR